LRSKCYLHPFVAPRKNDTIVFISPWTGRKNHPRY